MTMAADLFKQFQIYWQAGTDARLHLECHAGKVWMNLQIHLNHPPPPPPPQRHHQQPRQSPSRMRRRARRAQARAAAAAVNKATEDVAIQTEDNIVHTNDEVRPADSPILHSLPANVHVQQHQEVAGEAARVVNAGHVPCVPDVFCPDRVYHNLPAAAQVVSPPPCQNNIPQIDGHVADVDEEQGDGDDQDWINPDPISGMWICRCCYYAHSFMTEDDLKTHHDTLTMLYDECNVCYPWHVWS